MTNNYLLDLAINYAIEAGDEILKIYNDKINVSYKKDHSPLTDADIKSHEIIVNGLKNSGLPILSEEDSNICYEVRKKWKKFWLIDPIDGTKEFINKNGEFTINIALVENQKPVIGVIYVPVKKTLYYSRKKCGSYKHIIKKNQKIKLFKSSERLPMTKNEFFCIVTSRSHPSDETLKFINKQKLKNKNIKLIAAGSSLKFCMVAEGVADLYPRFGPTMEWDIAAAVCICLESNVTVKTLDSNSNLIFNKKNLINPNFICKR